MLLLASHSAQPITVHGKDTMAWSFLLHVGTLHKAIFMSELLFECPRLIIVVLYPVLLSSSSPLNEGGQTFIPDWRLSLFTSLYPIYLSQALCTINLLHFQLHLTICFQEDPAITIMTTGDLPVKIACRAAQKLKGTRLVRSFWKFSLVKT